MTIRSKARRRVAILLAAAVLLAAGVGGAYVFRQHQRRARALEAREQGLVLFDKGDYPAAVEAFGRYLARFSRDNPDPAIALKYAQGIEKNERPDGSHILDAINAYRFYLNLAPADSEARRNLLSLYVRAGFNAEAIDTAAFLLDPKTAPDPRDLRFRALAYFRLRRLPEAEADINAAIRANPLDLDCQASKLEIMKAQGRTSEEILDYTLALSQPDARLDPASPKSSLRKEALFKALNLDPAANPAAAEKLLADLKAHAGDPRIDLLQAQACQRIALDYQGGNNAAKAREWNDRARSVLLAASARPIPDLATLQSYANALDILECFPESLSLCQKGAVQNPAEVGFTRLAISRLLQSGDLAGVEARTGALKPDSDDPRLLALRAMALAGLGRADDVSRIVDALEKRPVRDRVAIGLASGARDAWLPTKADPEDRADRARKALSFEFMNPFLCYFLADALLASNDAEQAFENFNRAWQAAPAWFLPSRRQARMFLDAGSPNEALDVARRAQARAPGDRETAILVALATGEALPVGDALKPGDAKAAQAVQDALQLCDATEKRFPNSPELLPLRLRLLALLGQKAPALALLDAALAANPPLPAPTLASLAHVSQKHGLGYESRLVDLSEKSHGLTADLASERASLLAADGKMPEALASLKAAAAAHPQAPWRLAYARFLDLDIASAPADQRKDKTPEALKEWTRLGADFPSDLLVLRTMLASAVVQSDRDLTSKTIDRLRAKVGADTAEIQLARAELLLRNTPDGKEPPEAQVVEAASLLSDVTRLAPRQVHPRILLADIMSRRLGNPSGAIDQLRTALSLQQESGKTPDPAHRISLARLLNAQGQASAAVTEIRKIDPATLTPAQGPFYTDALIMLGEVKAAESFLEKFSTPDATLKLFLLNVATEDTKTADKLCSRVLEKPTPAAVEAVAIYYVRQKRTADAETVIKLLDALDAPAGAKEIIRGNYFVTLGDLDKAINQYVAAGRAMGGNPIPWRLLLNLCYGNARAADALRFLPEAAASIQDSRKDDYLRQGAPILALASAQESLQAGADLPVVNTLVLAALNSTTDVPALIKALRLVAAAHVKPSADFLPSFRDLAAANPKVPAIQLVLVQFLLLANRNEEALALANSTASAFPATPVALQFAYQAAVKLNRPNDAMAAARAWRTRLGRASFPADVELARLSLASGQLEDAFNFLKDHADSALKNPDANRDFITLYCQVLAAEGNVDVAERHLEPHLSDIAWRNSWLIVADYIPPASAATAASWLDRAEQKAASDQPLERVSIATHWVNLAHKVPADRAKIYYARARALFDPFVALPDADAGGLFLAGMFYEEVQDPAAAEASYRRALQSTKIANDMRASASNNLAMMLLRKGDAPSLEEAEKLAVNATTLVASAGFYDTLAAVRIARRQFPEALAAIDSAIKVDPRTAEWRVTRLAILSAMGDKTQAAQAFKDLQDFDLRSLSPDGKKRLEDYKKTR